MEKLNNLKDYEKMALSLLIMGIVILIIALWNAYDISKQEDKNIELENRIKQLETDYKIYEMNLSQLKENKEVQFKE